MADQDQTSVSTDKKLNLCIGEDFIVVEQTLKKQDGEKVFGWILIEYREILPILYSQAILH